MGVEEYRLLYHEMPMGEALTFLMSAGIQARVDERQRKLKQYIKDNLR